MELDEEFDKQQKKCFQLTEDILLICSDNNIGVIIGSLFSVLQQVCITGKDNGCDMDYIYKGLENSYIQLIKSIKEHEVNKESE